MSDLTIFYSKRMKRHNGRHVEVMCQLLRDFRIDWRQFRVIQVTGSCGKGSTVQALSLMLQANGIHYASFTGPHLQHYAERCTINGQQMSESEWNQLEEEIVPQLVELSYYDDIGHFQVMVLIALLYFQRRGVELLILENGAGGAADPTNFFVPFIAVLTEITLDHQHLLGDTIAAITNNKLAIFKEETRYLIAGMYNEEARSELPDDPRVWRIGDHYQVRSLHSSAYLFTMDGETFTVQLPVESIVQQQNSANALAICFAMKRCGFELHIERCIESLTTFSLSCRMEYIGAFLLDGAHNVFELEKLRESLTSVKVARYIVTVTSQKESEQLYRALRHDETIPLVIVPNPFAERSLAKEIVAKRLAHVSNWTYRSSLADVLAEEVEGITVITTSLYLVGAAKTILTNRS